jgi:hypothetical protein
MSVTWDEAAALVEEMRPLVRADGADFKLAAVSDDGWIDIHLLLDGVSCLECVLPPDLLSEMVSDSTRRSMPSCPGARLHDPRVV